MAITVSFSPNHSNNGYVKTERDGGSKTERGTGSGQLTATNNGSKSESPAERISLSVESREKWGGELKTEAGDSGKGGKKWAGDEKLESKPVYKESKEDYLKMLGETFAF